MQNKMSELDSENLSKRDLISITLAARGFGHVDLQKKKNILRPSLICGVVPISIFLGNGIT